MQSLTSVMAAAFVCAAAAVGVISSTAVVASAASSTTAVAASGPVLVDDGPDIVACPLNQSGCRKTPHPGQDV